MYSRKTGILRNESEVQKKIDSFNNQLREQYRRRSNEVTESHRPIHEEKNIAQSTDLLMDENILLIGLILLLLSQENKDFLLIGAIAALLLLTH